MSNTKARLMVTGRVEVTVGGWRGTHRALKSNNHILPLKLGGECTNVHDVRILYMWHISIFISTQYLIKLNFASRIDMMSAMLL